MMQTHLQTLNEKVVIRGHIEALTALHIGSSRSYDPASADAPFIKDLKGTPFIPGSTFKGVLRSFVERFLDGAVAGNEAALKPCFMTDGVPCISKEELYVYDDEDDTRQKKTAHIFKNACPVCRIFGGVYLGGKIKMKDMHVKKEEWHEAFLRIRNGITIDRDSRTGKDKSKYDFETVSPGVVFQMEIAADNLSDAEKGLLFIAFELISLGYGTIGGKASRGAGRIKIDIHEIEVFRPGDFFHQYIDNDGKVAPVRHSGTALADYITSAKDAFVLEFS